MITADAICDNCHSPIYRAQNYPMDGGWYWCHIQGQERRCLIFAEPKVLQPHLSQQTGT